MITMGRQRLFRDVGLKTQAVLPHRFGVIPHLLLFPLLVSHVSAADGWSSLLKQHHESKMARWSLQRGEVSEAAYLKSLARHRVDDQRRAARFIGFATKGRLGPAVEFMALEQVLTSAYSGSAGERAARIVIAKHLHNGLIGGLCYKIGFGDGASLASERVLRAVIQKSNDREAVAVATVALARFLRQKFDAARTMATLPGRSEIATVEYGRDYVKNLEAVDTSAVETEVLELLRRATISYANLKVLRGQVNIGELADRELIYARTQLIGKKAAEIVGSDANGKSFKLSDYDGKVRVLLFWGHWCVPCREAYPRYQRLVTRYADKPFAFLGINSDLELATLNRITNPDNVTWRCWWDGHQEPLPIHDQWKIIGAPHTFVLDGEGTICFRDLRGKDLEDAVEHLMTRPSRH